MLSIAAVAEPRLRFWHGLTLNASEKLGEFAILLYTL
jgi:hypothetical protein